MKKVISLLLSVAFVIVTLSACSNTLVWTNKEFDGEAQSQKIKSGKVIAENSNYSMIWDATTCCVKLQKKDTLNTWGISPVIEGEPEVDSLGMPIKKHPMLESALVIECLNPDTNLEEQFMSYNAVVKNGRVAASEEENGVTVEYYFDEVEIMVPVKYTLEGEKLSLSINTSAIQENSYKLTSISVLPYICSAVNDSEDSYLFYPSGSGALIATDTVSDVGMTYSSQVYGKDPVMKVDNKVSSTKDIRIPVFGAKSADLAVCGVIENAAESAIIETTVGSSSIKHSGVYAKFLVRGYSPNTAQFMNNVEKELNIYSSSMINTEIKIGYYPLENEKANYVGMAEVYRNYLLSDNKNSEGISEKILNLSFIGGIKTDKSFCGIPYESVEAATTLNQAKEILSNLNETLNTDINCRLLGYGSDGLNIGDYGGNFKINKNLGTASDLSDLNDYCTDNKARLFFDFDLINFKNSSSGYNKYFDVAYSSLNKIADIYDYNVATAAKVSDSKHFLLSRELLNNASDKLLSKINKWNISGLSLNTLSNICYSDYSVKGEVGYYSKGNMDADVTSIFEKIGKKYDISSDDANAYAAAMSSIVFNSPTKSAGEQIFKCDIPFYQIVFKGNVALSGEAINTADNAQKEFLKTVECGIGLNYTVIYEFKNEFVDFAGYDLLSSEYGDVKEQIVKNVNEYGKLFEKVSSTEIASHAVLDNGLRETVFVNGVKVYVNYTNEELESPLGTIGALDYKWGDSE